MDGHRGVVDIVMVRFEIEHEGGELGKEIVVEQRGPKIAER